MIVEGGDGSFRLQEERISGSEYDGGGVPAGAAPSFEPLVPFDVAIPFQPVALPRQGGGIAPYAPKADDTTAEATSTAPARPATAQPTTAARADSVAARSEPGTVTRLDWRYALLGLTLLLIFVILPGDRNDE